MGKVVSDRIESKISMPNMVQVVRACVMLTLVIICSMGQARSQAANVWNGQRYVALMNLNLSLDGAEEKRIIQMAGNAGMNALYLTIPWDFVYFTTPQAGPDWSRYDEQIKMATDMGMSVAIRIQVSRSKNRLTGYWDWDKDGMKDHTKISHMGGYSTSTFRYNNERVVELAAGFVQEVVRRYKWVHDANKLLFVSVTNTPEQEAGYPTSNLEPDTDTPEEYQAIYDCSDETIEEFRTWLKKHYGKIERLNHVWGSDFESFEVAHPLLTYWDPVQTFRFRYGKDWYLFRHEILKRYTERMIRAVKGVDAGIRYVSDYGSVLDVISNLRGTIAFGDLNEKADGVKINDMPEYDNRFTMDVIRGGMPAGKILANEVFVNETIDINAARSQMHENFDFGADMVAMVISTVSTFQRIQPVIKEGIERWQRVPKVVRPQNETVHYSSLLAVESSIHNVIYSHWRNAAMKNPSNPVSVNLKPGNEFFDKSYWDVVVNKQPYLKLPLGMRIVQVGKEFELELSKNNFADLDGYVDRIEIQNLPTWLQFDGNKLKGKATSVGDFRVNVTAIDDEGGRFTAYQTIRISQEEDLNKPPLVQINLGPFSAKKGERFTYTLPSNLFTDEDGQIVKIEALELPNWITYTNGVLTGQTSTITTERILLRATDNENAFVETFWEVSVVEPLEHNNSPTIQNEIQPQYGPEKELFEYTIPNNIFADSDGYVASMILYNSPTWLSMSFNRIFGVPPHEGEFNFFIRAYDNRGAYVDAPFTLRVERPFLNFTLQEAGNTGEEQIIGKIDHNSFFDIDSLPAKLNVSVSSNYTFERLELRFIAPFQSLNRRRQPPFTFLAGRNGFAAQIGQYELVGDAYTWDNKHLFTTGISFKIGKRMGDLALGTAAWTAFPNPFGDVVGLKIDPTIEIKGFEVYIRTMLGNKIYVPNAYMFKEKDFIQINFSRLGLTSGIYFIDIESDGVLMHRSKVVKN